MLLWPKFAGLFIALVTSATLLLSGCSSSTPQDINKGTDVGLFFVPPDVAPVTPAYDAAIDAESAVDSDNAADGGVSVDAAIDGDN
jgi:hypothetical protein